jgi:EAL domain-containing protein (putative c-di-GMP-specific phosphodiesterase class I)
MEKHMSHSYLTRELIDQESIKIYMQPIISHHEGFAIGIEAFVKGIHPRTKQVIEPNALFEKAVAEDLDIALGQLVIKKTVQVFRHIQNKHPESLLFININESIIHACEETHTLKDLIEAQGISPKSVVFDIGNYENMTVEQIQAFINQQRIFGFYISIDDIGKDYFNLDRIILFNPDIIKINHQYLARLNNPSYTKRILKHMGQIAHEMGMIVVETGIETENGLMLAFEQGAQYFQGYYIKEPVKVSEEDYIDLFDLQKGFELIRSHAKTAVIEDMRHFMNKMVMFLGQLKAESHNWPQHSMEENVNQLFAAYPSIENGWIINKEGVQVSDAMINNTGFSSRNADIFKIHNKGYDYSEEDLYRFINGGSLEVWITKPYISLLTNSICVTTSSYIQAVGEEPHILCLVFNYELFKKSHL